MFFLWMGQVMLSGARIYGILLLAIMLPSASQAARPDFEIHPINAITDDYELMELSAGVPGDPLTIDFVVTPGEYEPASFVVYANNSVAGLRVQASGLSNSAGEILEGANLDIRVVKRWFQRNVSISSPVNLSYLKPELLVYDDSLIRVEEGENFLRLETGEYVNVSDRKNRKKVKTTQKAMTPSVKDFPVRDAVSLQPVNLREDERRQFWVTLHTSADTPPGHYQAVIELLHDERVASVIPVAVEVLPFELDEPSIEYSFFYRGRLEKSMPEGSVSSEFKSEAQMLADLKNLRAHGISNPTVYQKLHTGLLDRVLELRQEAGINAPRLFYLGMDPWSDKNVRDTLRIVDFFGVEDVYFYARDEASGELLIQQLPLWLMAQNAGGKIIAAGNQANPKEEGNFSVTGGQEDLFVSLGALNKAEADRWHSKGKLIFSYQNPTGGMELPETWRRNYGLLLWQADYDGAMPYAWQHSYRDGWNDFDDRERDHNFIYPTVDKPIDTLQWEGFREGVDDVRYLTTLVNMLESEAAGNSPYIDDARAWVKQLKTLPLMQYDLDEIRARNAAYIIALSGWSGELTAVLKLTDVTVSPVEPDGSLEVSWLTSARATAGLKVLTSPAAVSVSLVGSPPKATSHAVKLTGVKPGRSTVFSISSALSVDSDPVTASGRINIKPKMSFTDISGGVNDAGLLVKYSNQSDYRSSVGIDIDRSLLGWWRFTESDDEVADLSTWGHAGKLKGSAEPADGWFGAGAALKGDGGFFSLPDIEIEENGTATIEGWFRFHSFAMDKVRGMDLFSGLYQHGNNNAFYFARTNEYFWAGSLLNRNVWHHIAVSWDGGTETAKMYIDGRSVPLLMQGKAEKIGGINGLTIGRRTGYIEGIIGGYKNTFDGDIDEIRVWSRVLSADEIRESYRGGVGKQELQVKNPGDAAANWKVIGANAADEYAIQGP